MFKKIFSFCARIYNTSSFIRYAFVGGISTLADMLVLFAVNRLCGGMLPDDTVRLAVATYSGGIIGFIVNYILTLVLAFNSEADRARGKSFLGFLLTLIVSAVGWGLKALLMELLVNVWKLGAEWIINIPVSCVTLVWNYIGRKLIVFRGKKS